MAIDEADSVDASEYSDGDASEAASDEDVDGPTQGSSVRVGEYTWAEFMEEFGHGDEVSSLYPHGTEVPDDQLGLDADDGSVVPEGDDWESVSFDPESYLGFHPDDLPRLISETAAPNANVLREEFLEYVDPETTPVVKDVYTWEHYKWEYYYDDDGDRPRTSDGEIDRFDEEEALGFDPDDVEGLLYQGGNAAMALDDVVEERTVNVNEQLEEDEFFSTIEGHTTVVNRYDLEKAVPLEKKTHFVEEERYWVNKPYAFVIIFHSEKENEKKYYLIEPYCNEIETELQEFLSGKLRTAIKYSKEGVKSISDEDGRRDVIEQETRRLLKRYDLFDKTSGATKKGLVDTLRDLLDDEDDGEPEPAAGELDGLSVRPEPVILEEDPDTLSEYQVEKVLYLLKRDFIGYERIDGIKHDINVEDISVDGYNSPVFVYHSEYEQIITNIYHGEEELDDFVVKLAQRSGKGISKRLPQVDATLPDGSRAQLTLGKEVSDHGTNYTIRQFKDVPFTPVDLINWNTFSLDEMAFLWLCIENHKSLIFAGGTASGKTTSLNAVSLFIPSNTKIVSIEDTREVELPQRNWIASMTRPSFSDDSEGDIDEFDLLEAALRQRPDYIVMGEIRGEEGRTLFQVMSTGHTTYTTFHADSVDEVLKRFTTDPINVSKTMFTALDLVSIQTQTRVQGNKVRRNKSLTEINHYEAEHDEINVQDVYQWQAETDEYLKMGDSNTLDEIQFDRGWSHEKLQDELFKRKVILAHLIKNELNTYAQVAATVQAFINDPDTILTLIANGQLEDSLEDLREMESVLINVDQEKEELVPRPDPTSETYNLSMDILERAEESLFEEYRGKVPSGLASALGEVEEADPIEVDGEQVDDDPFGLEGGQDAGLAAGQGADDGEWNEDDGPAEFGFDDTEFEASAETPSWLEADAEPDDDGVAADAAAEASAAEASAEADGTATESPVEPQSPEGDETEPESAAVGDAGPPDTLELDSPSGSTASPDSAGGPPQLEGSAGSAGATAGSADQAPGEGESDDEKSNGIDSLFTDMGSTLAELEAEERAAETSDADAGQTDGAVEDPFDGRDLDSIFDADAETDDGAGDDAGGSETDAEGSDGPPADETGGDETPQSGDIGERPDGEGTDGTTDAEPADSTVDDDAARSPRGAEDPADDTADTPPSDGDSGSGESIFGDASEPVFSDDDEDGADEDDGFLFESDGSDDDSIFGGADGSNADDDSADADGSATDEADESRSIFDDEEDET